MSSICACVETFHVVWVEMPNFFLYCCWYIWCSVLFCFEFWWLFNLLGFTFCSQGFGNFEDFKKLDWNRKFCKEEAGKLVFFFWFLSAKNQDLIWLIFPSCPVQRHVPKQKTKKTNVEVEPRRSSRVRNPVRSYREDVSNIVFQTTINP